ncbi:MAG TPA: Rieske (2Fe-2S) protein [Mycobacterium sp.]|jgi:nitrite reductase/ring-hydroxylating ferredoxin subunit|nr:Rieske (2Fe-2S) protein [Mycobacterium sp.]
MNARGLRRYVDDLLRGRRPKPFAPDDFEAAQIRTAIELRAARQGSDVVDAPRQEFLSDLHRRLAEQMPGAPPEAAPMPNTTRRQVLVGTSAAAAAAVAAVSIDRAVMGSPAEAPAVAGHLTPNDGSWQRVAASSDVPDGIMHPFDLGSISGFVRRIDGKPEALSGVCTHQGCRLWFDAPDDRLRCPCHSTSFSPTGQVLTHQLPIAPKPLPTLMVREVDGVIEVFAPASPDQPA